LRFARPPRRSAQLKVADHYVNLPTFIRFNIMNIEALAGGVMKTSSLRHKHVQLDQRKLNRALRILGARTETEALDRALSVVVSEDKIDTALRKARGKGRIRKVFK
jgi:hypothetical protein